MADPDDFHNPLSDIPVPLEQDAVTFASRAVQCDQNNLVDTAIFYYKEAAQALIHAHAAGSRLPGLLEKAAEYTDRAEQLIAAGPASRNYVITKSQQQLDVERARYLVQQAFQEDEQGHEQEAFELYTQAAQLCLKLRSESADKELQSKVTKLAEQALDRAEQLKASQSGVGDLDALCPAPPSDDPPGLRPATPSGGRSAATPSRPVRPLGFSLQDLDPGPGTAPRPSPSGGATGSYTREEIQVLRTTSMINNTEYVPFMSVDMRERFAYPVPFTDKHGKLVLSPKQRQRLSRWARPEDFCDDPKMIYAISSFSIKQTVVSDCSFVASLAISAQYERRYNKKLITSIIYPQNRKGEPQYNPCGKYMVKFIINGVPRKVIVDDLLPLGSGGELLCSYSNNKNELWVSLLEKAYLKVMGGYDFPGSNSNIDLHALTGWIPERVAIRPGSEDFDADKEYNKIKDRFHKGHCLVTIATGDMTEADADRAGLVPTHAYAMLDVRVVQNHRLLQLKNPWSHLRWKGNFSELDTVHWTPEMKKLCNFDPTSASMFDNGVFWIDYDSLLKFFDVIYINWNPDLFPHTTCIHHTWTCKEGPKKDTYNIGDNPQYRLEVQAPSPSAVWILLTRHITDKDDFANNREFITVLVYKTQGKRVYYPYDPPPYKDGVRINSPHYLCKMVQEPGTGLYTLVISQYEKSSTIHYTLRVYSTCRMKLSQITEPYKHEKQVTGQWQGRSAGGCGNYTDTHRNNPVFQVKLDHPGTSNAMLVELRGPKQYSIGFTVTTVSENVAKAPGAFDKKHSGDFRRGFSVLELEDISGGVYNISPCTFLQGQEGPFILNVSASCPLSLTQLQ